jgi:N-acetylmuramic acid 6-phosphate (MurNAc-6-P) etherase
MGLRWGDAKKPMPKRQDVHEERAIKILEQIMDIERSNRDALPGSAVKHVKEAITILKKRRNHDQ